MSIKTLQQIGLSEEQAKIYYSLINNGTLSARKITLETGVSRTLVYKVIKQLIDLGLVSEHEYDGKISKFTALPPINLQKIVDKQNEETKLANHAVSEAISILGAQFNLSCGKPTVRFYEGVEGIETLNKDILHTKSDLKILRSPMDNDTKKLDEIVKKQIKEQVGLGIKSKVIVPMDMPFDDFIVKKDKENLVTRCRIPREEFKNNAQIILYGNKVGFTSFVDCMITTIIEDESIRETMDMLFEALWEKYSI